MLSDTIEVCVGGGTTARGTLNSKRFLFVLCGYKSF